MSRKKEREQPKRDGRSLPSAGKGKIGPVYWICLGLAVAVAIAGVYFAFYRPGLKSAETESPSARQPGTAKAGKNGFQPLLGRWIRPDGGYILSVRSVSPEGRVDVGYFNPRPIHVSRADASVQGNTVKLFVELQAAGYPGSTYELIYDRGNDALVGIYFQAAIQQRFEVVFVRTD